MKLLTEKGFEPVRTDPNGTCWVSDCKSKINVIVRHQTLKYLLGYCFSCGEAKVKTKSYIFVTKA